MSITEQLELVAASLSDWGKTWKATVQIAADRSDVLARIIENPDRPHCYVYFDGEEPVDENSKDSGMFNHNFTLVVSRGRGMTIDQASGLVKSTPAKESLLGILESGRKALRGINFTPTRDMDAGDREQILPAYKGMRHWRGRDGWPVDAFELEIAVVTFVE